MYCVILNKNCHCLRNMIRYRANSKERWPLKNNFKKGDGWDGGWGNACLYHRHQWTRPDIKHPKTALYDLWPCLWNEWRTLIIRSWPHGVVLSAGSSRILHPPERRPELKRTGATSRAHVHKGRTRRDPRQKEGPGATPGRCLGWLSVSAQRQRQAEERDKGGRRSGVKS